MWANQRLCLYAVCAKFCTSSQSRSPVCIRRVALITHATVATDKFATSMGSLEGSPSDATDLSLLAKKRPQLSLSLKKHGTAKCFRLPIKENFEAAAQGVVMWEVLVHMAATL